MSESVYHDLSIFHTVDSTPAVEWVNERLKETRCYEFSITQSPYYKPERLSFLQFVTPWEPQLARILEASRQFPDTQFKLEFIGSVGTTLEQTVVFTMWGGAILTFESGAWDMPLDKMFFDVLDYCGRYAGNLNPTLRGFAALCLEKGIHVQDANGREVTHDSLVVDELTPQQQWAGISPQDFAKTVLMYMIPTRRAVEAYLEKMKTGIKTNKSQTKSLNHLCLDDSADISMEEVLGTGVGKGVTAPVNMTPAEPQAEIARQKDGTYRQLLDDLWGLYYQMDGWDDDQYEDLTPEQKAHDAAFNAAFNVLRTKTRPDGRLVTTREARISILANLLSKELEEYSNR